MVKICVITDILGVRFSGSLIYRLLLGTFRFAGRLEIEKRTPEVSKSLIIMEVYHVSNEYTKV